MSLLLWKSRFYFSQFDYIPPLPPLHLCCVLSLEWLTNLEHLVQFPFWTHMSFWCLFLDPCLTYTPSNICVHLRWVNEVDPLTLQAMFLVCNHFTLSMSKNGYQDHVLSKYTFTLFHTFNSLNNKFLLMHRSNWCGFTTLIYAWLCLCIHNIWLLTHITYIDSMHIK